MLWCGPFHWIVRVAFGTPPLSLGRVGGATGQTYGKAGPLSGRVYRFFDASSTVCIDRIEYT